MISIENTMPAPKPLSLNPRFMRVFALVALTCIVFPITPLDVWPNPVLTALKAALSSTRGKILAVTTGMATFASLILGLETRKRSSETELSSINSELLSSVSTRNSRLRRKNEILRDLPGYESTSNGKYAKAAELRGKANANSARRNQINYDLNNRDLDLTQAQRDALNSEYITLKEAYPGLKNAAFQAEQDAAVYDNTYVKPLQKELREVDGDLRVLDYSIANLQAAKTAKEAELGVIDSDMSNFQTEYDRLGREYETLRMEEYRLLNEIAAEEAKSGSGSSQ